MMNLFTAELRKLFLLFKADPKSLMAGIIAPTILLIIFAITFGNFTGLKLAFVNEDAGTQGAVLETSIFSQISPLGQEPYFEKVHTTRDDAFARYARGSVSGVVVVGESFSDDLRHGNQAAIEYHFNNYNTDMAKNMRLYLSEGLLDFYRTTDPAIQIDVDEVLNVETQLPWFHIIAVAVFLLAFLLGAMFNMLYLFYKEKTYGTVVEYRLAPGGIWPSLCARVVMALFAGSITAAINAVFVFFFTGINLLPFLMELAAPLLVLGSTYVLFAVVVALSVESFGGAAVFTMAATVILWFLSGATASIKYATGILKAIALGIPNTYGLSQIRGVVFAMDPSVGGILTFQAGWILMLGYLGVGIILAGLVFHRKMGRFVK